jgi:hypothetical protein
MGRVVGEGRHPMRPDRPLAAGLDGSGSKPTDRSGPVHRERRTGDRCAYRHRRVRSPNVRNLTRLSQSHDLVVMSQ